MVFPTRLRRAEPPYYKTLFIKKGRQDIAPLIS